MYSKKKLHLNRIKWRRVISRYTTLYGQTLEEFKRNGEKTKLHEIKIIAFLDLAYVVLWPVFRHELHFYQAIIT